jgi:hypothetical protein
MERWGRLNGQIRYKLLKIHNIRSWEKHGFILFAGYNALKMKIYSLHGP